MAGVTPGAQQKKLHRSDCLCSLFEAISSGMSLRLSLQHKQPLLQSKVIAEAVCRCKADVFHFGISLGDCLHFTTLHSKSQWRVWRNSEFSGKCTILTPFFSHLNQILIGFCAAAAAAPLTNGPENVILMAGRFRNGGAA